MLLIALTTIVALLVVLTDFGLCREVPRSGRVAHVSPRTAMCSLPLIQARPRRRPQQAHRAADLRSQARQQPDDRIVLYDHTGPGGARLYEACSMQRPRTGKTSQRVGVEQAALFGVAMSPVRVSKS